MASAVSGDPGQWNLELTVHVFVFPQTVFSYQSYNDGLVVW